MAQYLIEFRFHGYAKRYAKKLIYDVSKKFRVRGVTKKKVVPHITMYGPFSTRNHRMVATTIERVVKKYELVQFRVKDFNYFNNQQKVIYLEIEPSEELKNLRYEIAQELLKVTSSKSNQDRKRKNDFKFHSTICFKDIDKKFPKIWKYLKEREEPNIHQFLLRITILRGRKILYEYDLMQKRLLNRKQALNHQIFLKTVNILKQKQEKIGYIEPHFVHSKKKDNFWEKMKKLLKIR